MKCVETREHKKKKRGKIDRYYARSRHHRRRLSLTTGFSVPFASFPSFFPGALRAAAKKCRRSAVCPLSRADGSIEALSLREGRRVATGAAACTLVPRGWRRRRRLVKREFTRRSRVAISWVASAVLSAPRTRCTAWVSSSTRSRTEGC